MKANFAAPLPILETENCVNSQCPEFYAEDALMLSQVIYLGLLWLGLIVLLNPGVTIGNFTKKISEAVLVVNHQFYMDLGVISVTIAAVHIMQDYLLLCCLHHLHWPGMLAPLWNYHLHLFQDSSCNSSRGTVHHSCHLVTPAIFKPVV
ncbi:hypothetical protein DSO57_1000120 [Entomophthora muscae]|uniref:Uncharacterized protein n=1 Tax=Entomophthora muscae TaxID=34485 RepID=A0ACC2SN55_9FUNG|nr:hypothetical protein DSO57_1000120 [Entomophthora muscae]